MAITRKNVRDALNQALQHATNGFNAKLAAVAATYGIAAFTIDWTAGSKKFFQGFLTPEAVDLSQVIEFPALILYTTTQASRADREKFGKFAGDVSAQLDFYVEFRAGMETDLSDSYGDAIEDAILEVMAANLSIFHGLGVYWNGDYEATRDPVVQFQNGWGQRIPITLTFSVHA